MVVALGAAERRAQPHARGVANAVGEVDRAVLLRLRAALLGRLQQSVVAGGDALRVRRAGQQVAGQLLGGEAVEGQVGVPGSDHPVAVAPHRARVVAVVPDAVGVAHEVEPEERHPLAEVRGGEQAVDLALVGVGAGVLLEGARLLRGGRQADEIEAQPAQQLGAARLGRRREPSLLDPRQHERVDRGSAPAAARGGGRSAHRRQVGPVRLVPGALRDPAPQRRDLLRPEPCAPALRERHAALLVGVLDAGQERAALRDARHDRHRAGRERALGDLLAVEPQAGLACVLVGPVAGEAALGQDRPHVAVVAQVAGVARPRARAGFEHRGARLGDLDRHTDGPGRAGLDPSAQRLDLGGGERLCLLRHAVLGVAARDLLVQQARGGIARDHDVAGVAPFAEERFAVEAQERLALARTVAADARRREDRQHLTHEVRSGLDGGEARGDGAAERERRHERHDERNGEPGASRHKSAAILHAVVASRRQIQLRVDAQPRAAQVNVAVVGAGPAGSLLGYHLARSGARVTVFDPSHPREKPCGRAHRQGALAPARGAARRPAPRPLGGGMPLRVG